MQKIVIPSNVEAEAALLGCIIVNENILLETRDLVPVEYFYDSRNRAIYRAMISLQNEKKHIDITTLISYLTKENLINEVGGLDYLGSLANVGYSTPNVNSYIDLIVDSAMRRNSIDLLTKLVQDGYNNEISTFDYIENIEKGVFELSKRRSVDGFKTIGDVSRNVLEATELHANQKEAIIGLKTGFPTLDRLTLGFQPGQLIILAARPSMGKSAMGLNLAEHIAVKNKQGKANVAVFSLEMSAEQLVERMIACDSKIELSNIKTGNIQANEWVRFNTSCSRLSKLGIYFDDSTDLTVAKIRAKCRKQAVETGLDFVVIDYLQLINSPNDNKALQEQVAKISRELKLMAMELQIPVLVLSQLSRAVEKREDKHPIMADLRDSGSIEQDADIVMFLYRDDYYNKASARKGEADFIISKNRSGQTHEGIPLLFNGGCACFEEKIGD